VISDDRATMPYLTDPRLSAIPNLKFYRLRGASRGRSARFPCSKVLASFAQRVKDKPVRIYPVVNPLVDPAVLETMTVRPVGAADGKTEITLEALVANKGKPAAAAKDGPSVQALSAPQARMLPLHGRLNRKRQPARRRRKSLRRCATGSPNCATGCSSIPGRSCLP
jgi:hypothetical protein